MRDPVRVVCSSTLVVAENGDVYEVGFVAVLTPLWLENEAKPVEVPDDEEWKKLMQEAAEKFSNATWSPGDCPGGGNCEDCCGGDSTKSCCHRNNDHR